MIKHKLIRITTIPVSLNVLLKGQHNFMAQHYEVVGISSEEGLLKTFKSFKNN